MSSIATIGVYGFDRPSFLEALAAAKIDLLSFVSSNVKHLRPEEAAAS